MIVELDIFSGRPNPRWQLDDSHAGALRELVAGLAPAADRPPEPPGLGYRGFVLADRTGEARAYRAYVVTRDTVLADPSLSVEHLLLDNLPPEFEELRPRVELELQGPL